MSTQNPRLIHFLTMILAISIFAVECKSRTIIPKYAVKTDETQAVLRKYCRDSEPEGNLEQSRKDLCTCIKVKRAGVVKAVVKNDICSFAKTLKTWEAQIRSSLLTEGEAVFQNDNHDPITVADKACLTQLAEVSVEDRTSAIEYECNDSQTSDAEFSSILDLPQSAQSGKCWVLTHMTSDACILAKPCVSKGSSDAAALPLAADARKMIKEQRGSLIFQEGESLKLCHDNIRDIHRLKDPLNSNIDYNYAFANILVNSSSYNHITYGPANCHGTAQAVIGGLLEGFPVPNITYHSDQTKSDCSDLANEMYESGRVKTKAQGKGDVPLAGSINVERGGYLINMNHDESCNPDNCGEVSFNMNWCPDGKAIAHIFFSDMCINCWDRLLNNAGYAPLPATASWRKLKPGCVLTQGDHSVAFLMENNGFCYYYEATSPFGPPQLRVEVCNVFYSRFPKRWCPIQPLTFDVIL